MKQTICLCLLSLFLFESCCLYGDCEDTDNDFRAFSNYEPIVISRDSLNNSIELQELTGTINSGKIYVKDDLLFVGEKTTGIPCLQQRRYYQSHKTHF